MFRFSKQHLLMTEFQTPDVKHEENWIRLVMLAYAQLWAAKDLATHLLRPWERYLKPESDTIITPSAVQRDFQRIISEIGTPTRSPKTRGNSIGIYINYTDALLNNVSIFLSSNPTKLLRIQLALLARAGCPPHNHLEKILVQIKGATAYLPRQLQNQ